MGSLQGHLMPGTFILCFGFWWTYSLFDHYFTYLVETTVTRSDDRFKSQSAYSAAEGWLKIVFTLMGISIEFITALDDELRFAHMGQHNAYRCLIKN